jgi:hypothetical protein
LLVPIALVCGFLIAIATVGKTFGYFVAGGFLCLYAAYTFLSYVRTRSAGVLVVTVYQASAGLFLISAATASRSGLDHMRPLTAILLGTTLFFGVWMFGLAASKRYKWRGRDLLELAGQAVDETAGATYTERPRPAGRAEYTAQDIEAFAAYCRRNLVALPYFEQHRLVLVLVKAHETSPYMLGLNHDYTDDTWVAFDDEGYVTVHISKADYLLYREDLSFDQLSAALGKVFVEFLTLFMQGKQVRIIDRLNAMPVGVFS